MAAATELLVSEAFGSASVRDLLERTLAPFGIDDGQRFKLDGPAMSLPPHLVAAFALALHELATNATKYGALSNAAGVVEVTWERIDRATPALLRLRWIERAGPPVVAPERSGFGTQLIRRVLASEAGGSAEIDYRPDGVVFTAVLPLSLDQGESVAV